MNYSCKIFYANDAFACKAINFIGDQFNRNPRLEVKVEDVLIPIEGDGLLSVRLCKGINQPLQADLPNYIIIEDRLLTPDTEKFLDVEAENQFKDLWVLSERELEQAGY